MNTKLIMSIVAIVIGAVGIFLSFAPDILLGYLHMDLNATNLLMIQIIGALYVGFAMLNWMAKGMMIGGIYSRPLVVANFAHFLIGGLALIKGLMSNPTLPIFLWVVVGVYVIFAVVFARFMFRNPLPETTNLKL